MSNFEETNCIFFDCTKPTYYPTAELRINYAGKELTSKKSSENLRRYLPFGELFVEQRATANYYTPYKFSGKEKDEETSYSYFGARYYLSDISIWASVDPLADQAPGWTPYRYCFNNPIRLIDPDGMSEGNPDWFENEKTGEIMNVKGTSQLPQEEQGKGWVNIGKDDMFGGEHVPMGPPEVVSKMGDYSETFMGEHGYTSKVKEELLVQKITHYYYTEADGGIQEPSEPTVTTLKSETTKVTYVAKNNRDVNVQSRELYTLKVEGGVPIKSETLKIQRNYTYGHKQQNSRDYSKAIEFGSKLLQFVFEKVIK